MEKTVLIEENKERVNELLKYSDNFKSRNLEEAIIKATEAAEIAEKINYKEGLAKSYLNRGTCYRHKFENDKSLEDLFKALNLYKELNNIYGQVSVHNSISNVYGNLGDNDKSLEYLNNALHLAEMVNDPEMTDTIHSNIAGIYIHNGDLITALEHLLRILNQHNENGTEVSEVIFNNLAGVYYELGDKETALKYYTLCAEKSGKLRNNIARAHMLLNIGTIYSETGKNEEGINYANWGLKLLEDTGHKHGVIKALDVLSDIYLSTGVYEKACKLALKSKSLKEEFNDINGITESMHQIGYILLKQKNFEEAKGYFDNGLSMAVKLGNVNEEKLIHMSFAEFYTEMKNCTNAVMHLKQALNIAESQNAIKDKIEIYKRFYTAYKGDNDFENALNFHEKLFEEARKLNELESEKKLKTLLIENSIK